MNGAALVDRHDMDRLARRRAALIAAAVTVSAAALDQATKAVATQMLASGPAHVGVLHLRLVANRGILLGMIELPTWLITLIALTVVAVTGRAARRGNTLSSIAFALASGGAIGNLIDRYLQRPNFPPNAVVDWLSFGGMTFNLSDVFLVAAVLLLSGNESSGQTASSEIVGGVGARDD